MTDTTIRILVAEDEENLRSHISAWLKDEGFAVEEAVDGRAAVQKIQAGDFDIAMIDIRMPGSNGLEVLRYIKKNSAHTEVVMMTAMQDITMAVEAMKLGAREYLSKPIDMDHLVPQLRALLKMRDAEERLRVLQAEHTARLLFDLHNPIAGLKQSIGYLMKGMAGPVGDHQRELLGYMMKSIEKVILLLNDMMDLTKLEGGRVRLNRGIGNLPDTVTRVIQEHQIPISSSKVTLDYSAEPDLPPIEYDTEKIGQVLQTFLGDAVKVTPPTGTIAVHVRRVALVMEEGQDPSDFLLVSVANSGPAIPKAELPLIFDRYRNVLSENKDSQSAGLGMIICQRIVDAHNGKIWVESDREQGSIFFFALPVR
jgi:signal transduction histidine kinase